MNDCISCFKRPTLEDSCPHTSGPAQTNYLSAIVPVLVVMIAMAATALRAEQPIAYSHKIHIDHGLQCLDCHSGADTGARATIPSVSKCMLCHAKIATENPEVKKIAEFAAARREIPWERVYGFDPGA